MKTYSRMAIATVLIACLQAAAAHAQTAPAIDTTATPAPAASPAPAGATVPPAATSPAAASTDKAGPSANTAATESSTPQAKKSGKMSTQQQIEHALKTRTVPARYRSQVPKEYQKYIPFEK
jgi:hypothetical protein